MSLNKDKILAVLNLEDLGKSTKAFFSREPESLVVKLEDKCG